ncbi:zinc-binding alcohol dehydrogenase [Thalassobacillus sp. CUG 92003]|uniref:zinc-dependent alcohol dehydrogenase n=1 Tax=Thalassobacillus sp. CUG 92003 TaxID=2736641 RepID=UPI0015E7BD26|nr:zinc-binding alcohol dehydrogenase [Thalassobacillus sp. CUG 92003]
MRQVFAINKHAAIEETPVPEIKTGYVLVKTMHSIISPGTEATIIDNSMDKKIPLGYSAMGVVEACGNDVEDVGEGDLVACYGAPYVQHAEYLLVPKTLYSKVPDNVNPKEAALAGIGAIAIHALRVAKLEFGETIVIAGLGLLGQMIAKIADAAAYNVIAYDIHKQRVDMLQKETNISSFSERGALEKEIHSNTCGHGADAVLLCAGGNQSPLTDQSLHWIRDKGKVVIVGDIEPNFPRAPMFRKEAQVLISRAGGAGRYDHIYEKQATDYPYGFVRWTEGRNVAEYLRLVSEKRINVLPFLDNEIDFEKAASAYEELQDKNSTVLTKIINF